MIIPLKGDLIELIEMPDDPDPIPAGTRGTVTFVGPRDGLGQQIGVDWENGRSLMLVNGVDRFLVL